MNNEEFVEKLINKGLNNETKLQKKIQKYLKDLGAYEFKVHGSQYMKAGIPDIICCYQGKFIGIETKVGKNKMSKIQEQHKKDIEKAGGIHILAYSLEDVQKSLRKLFTIID